LEGVECTGVYVGVLQEDMIDTLRRVRRPFIDVLVPKIHGDGALDYPLTYVNPYGMCLPLRKGDRVWVRFEQDNTLYPVLHKLYAPLDGVDDGEDAGDEGEEALNGNHFMSDFVFPELKEGVQFEWPEQAPLKQVLKIGPDHWLVSSDYYSVWRKGETCFILDASGHYLYGEQLAFSSVEGCWLWVKDKFLMATPGDGVTVEISDIVKVQVKKGSYFQMDDNVEALAKDGATLVLKDKVRIGNNSQQMSALMDAFIDLIDAFVGIADGMATDVMGIQTAGSPAAHALNPAQIPNWVGHIADLAALGAQLGRLKTDFGQLLEG